MGKNKKKVRGGRDEPGTELLNSSCAGRIPEAVLLHTGALLRVSHGSHRGQDLNQSGSDRGLTRLVVQQRRLHQQLLDVRELTLHRHNTRRSLRQLVLAVRVEEGDRTVEVVEVPHLTLLLVQDRVGEPVVVQLARVSRRLRRVRDLVDLAQPPIPRGDVVARLLLRSRRHETVEQDLEAVVVRCHTVEVLQDEGCPGKVLHLLVIVQKSDTGELVRVQLSDSAAGLLTNHKEGRLLLGSLRDTAQVLVLVRVRGTAVTTVRTDADVHELVEALDRLLLLQVVTDVEHLLGVALRVITSLHTRLQGTVLAERDLLDRAHDTVELLVTLDLLLVHLQLARHFVGWGGGWGVCPIGEKWSQKSTE
eukprot:Hpha_TRINITY_DN15915_c5_g2::TRINITY_DN15915_c5_g2_i5::g.73279::m.73279